MKRLKCIVLSSLLAVLTACGGGGGGGSSLYSSSGSGSGNGGTSGGTSGPVAAQVEVLASSTSVGSNGDKVTITAVVKDANNVGLASSPVTFSASSGTLTGASTTTDATGTATASFATGANKSNRAATITVQSGSVSGSVVVDINGSNLLVSGPTSLSQGGSATLTVKAVDAAGNPISGTTVSWSSSLQNGFSATSGTTNSQGQVSVTYTATNAGSDTVSFIGAGTTVPSTMLVNASSTSSFAFTAPNPSTQVPVGQAQALQVTYLVNGVVQVGQTVNFTASGGSLSAASATTNGAGVATVLISSTTAMSAVVQASVSGGALLATLPLQFVATTPASLVLQATPTSIGPNTGGSTANQAQVTARVRDAQGNPVTGATVNFTRVADPSQGSLQQLSAVTDVNGLASVQYIAGATSTSSGGVQLRGTVNGTAVFGDTTLTVSQSALFIALGTGNTIGNADPQTYTKDWTAYVTDVNGAAVSGAQLTISVLPKSYQKGSLTWSDASSAWVVASGAVVCDNEDTNYNGQLDSGEDFNGDGLIQPGNVVALQRSVMTTDTNGRATITLNYAESYVPWIQVGLKVRALVSGTESSTENVFWVQGLSSDFTDENVPPAGVVSPFGIAATCNIPG